MKTEYNKIHNIQLGIYYSKKKDALISLFEDTDGRLCHTYSQWCPNGTWSKKEGYYHGFGGCFESDGRNGQHNFPIFLKEYNPKFVSNMNWIEFVRDVLVHFKE